LLGQLFLDQQNPSAAVAPLEHSLALDSSGKNIERNLALAYLGANRPGDALLHIGKVFNSDPSAALYIRGVAEGERREFALAVADLQAALQSNPDLTEAREALAQFQTSLVESTQAAQAQSASQGQASRFKLSADADPPVDGKPLVIPYSKLVMKSENWPLFP
jgi:tetratricopeptide (TPR) repeat protein